LSVGGSRALLLLIILIVAIGGYAFGLNMARRDITAGKQLIQQLQSESQKLEKQTNELSTSNIALQNKLASIQATMDTMKPAQNTYNLKPNQSIIAADGHLTLGLVGTPDNASVTININGKKTSAAPGDVIKVAADASTACQVMVQSFDMFAAVVTATCSAAKP
jgi:hypothetical protein